MTRVTVNGQAARALAANFAEWDAVLENVRPGKITLVAGAEDKAGNIEKRPHTVQTVVSATAE